MLVLGLGAGWAGAGAFRWTDTDGVLLQNEQTVVQFGGNAVTNSVRVRYPGNGVTYTLRNRAPITGTPKELVLTYEGASPDRVPFTIERRVRPAADPEGVALVETLTFSATQPLTNDVEIEIPFIVQLGAPPPPPKVSHPKPRTGRPAPGKLPPGKFPGKGAPAKSKAKPEHEPEVQMTCPLQNGWMRAFPLSQPTTNQVEYRLGNPLTASFGIMPIAGSNAPSGRPQVRDNAGQDATSTPQLALPVIQLSAGQNAAAFMTDPEFSSLFLVRSGNKDKALRGVIRYRYAAGKIPLRGPETRRFAVWIPSGKQPAAEASRAVDAWFRLMLPDVPPGPAWLHDIAMVDYDFLSDDGQGWERDVRALATWLKPAERRRVALCLHGWYDALGSYCYDAQNHRMKDAWVAFARTRKVSFTQAELKRRLNLAREQGFRVLLYFGDGLAADSGVPGYHEEWAYRDIAGRKTPGWQGPDTFGPTYLLNPAHPEVFGWFTNYMAALLTTYGREADGFVWDETFHARIAQVAQGPEAAYCDRAMFRLVKALTQQVHKLDPQKVFLTSDCIGASGMDDVPGYALVADGTYQDTHCAPDAWSYAVFPNWRNTFWSCNWDSLRGFHFTRWGAEQFGTPVAISNGWRDDRGPSEWTPDQREQFLALFRDRIKAKPFRPSLTDPRERLALAPNRPVRGDAIPEPAAGEINCALAAQGGQASASSFEQAGASVWPAAGAIDGVRDDTGWGAGHGWASKAGEPLPQWLQVDFGRERTIQRFTVITYQKEHSTESAGKWGIRDFQIEAWDSRRQRWQAVGTSTNATPAKVRVIALSDPVVTPKCRLVVREVAPLDGQVRLLQFEAWGH